MGRPIGTFGDPVVRARAWHWLSVIQTCTGVETARQLDRYPSIRRSLPANKLYFDLIRQDGYDPARMEVKPKTSLLKFIASKHRFKSTLEKYQHPLWHHLMKRSPDWPDRKIWLPAQLKLHAIVRVSPVDDSNGIELGLLPDVDPDYSVLPPLDLRPDRFATMDGLLLLLLLLREAQDATYTSRAERFKECLCRAAMEFSKLHGYAGEALDTWEVLIESRMLAWRPDIQPTIEQLKSAEVALRREMRNANHRGRKPTDPDVLKQSTRSERRWRRRVWMRACRLHFRKNLWPSFDYRNASLLYEWLAENREAIHLHISRAVELLVVGEEADVPQNLAPLCMPEELYITRQRNGASEAEWVVYGNAMPFDVIPVVPCQKKK